MSQASEHYAVADNEGEAFWFLGTLATIKAAGSQTGEGLSVIEFTQPLGFATPRHVHHADDEAFYVLAGALRGFCGDRSWRATPGSFVWLPHGIPHGYAVDGDETLRVLTIIVPSGFERFIAEVGEPARARVVPPPAQPDVEKLVVVAPKYGMEILGPPAP